MGILEWGVNVLDNVLEKIKEIAVKYRIEKVLLFGSRARRDASPVSDYDIVVFGKDMSALDRARFCTDADEIPTLKKIDIVFVNDGLTDDLMESIKKDGVVIYEKTGYKTN